MPGDKEWKSMICRPYGEDIFRPPGMNGRIISEMYATLQPNVRTAAGGGPFRADSIVRAAQNVPRIHRILFPSRQERMGEKHLKS